MSIKVKCEKCRTIFYRYDYRRHSVKHKHRHHRGHKGGQALSVNHPCILCGGNVETI